MKRVWNFCEAAIKDEIIDQIFEVTKEQDWEEARTGHTEKSEIDLEKRRSKIKWVGNTPEQMFIKNLVWEHAYLSNKYFFGFDIEKDFPVQMTKYTEEDSGTYDWHIDSFFNDHSFYDRKISVIVQLSDPDEYEGGDFEFHPSMTTKLNEDTDLKKLLRLKGTVITFPSFLLHRVTPVTRGTRYSLVSWIEGPTFK